MPRKAKAKRRGRPALAKGVRRTNRSIRLPDALWARAEAHGEVTATVEQALMEYLDRYDQSLK